MCAFTCGCCTTQIFHPFKSNIISVCSLRVDGRVSRISTCPLSFLAPCPAQPPPLPPTLPPRFHQLLPSALLLHRTRNQSKVNPSFFSHLLSLFNKTLWALLIAPSYSPSHSFLLLFLLPGFIHLSCSQISPYFLFHLVLFCLMFQRYLTTPSDVSLFTLLNARSSMSSVLSHYLPALFVFISSVKVSILSSSP